MISGILQLATLTEIQLDHDPESVGRLAQSWLKRKILCLGWTRGGTGLLEAQGQGSDRLWLDRASAPLAGCISASSLRLVLCTSTKPTKHNLRTKCPLLKYSHMLDRH